MRQVAIGVTFVVAVMALALYSGARGEDSGSEREAVTQCEDFANERLKSPATAEYDLAAKEDGDGWLVVGTVDSENGFGANVRSAVECRLHIDGDTATLDGITIG